MDTPPINAAELLLADHADDGTAIECGGERFSYGELRDRTARAAAVWRAHGVGPGSRVAVKLPDGIDWVVAWLGAVWAGGVAVGVNPRAPEADWRFMLEQADFGVIVAESPADTPEPWRRRVITLAEGRAAVASAAPVPPQRVDGETPAFWVHSSGTSGRPKAVVHAHRCAQEIGRISHQRLGIGAGDRLFASSRLFFAYPLTNLLLAGLRIGATLVLDDQWPSAVSVAATTAQSRVTVLFSVPSLYRDLLHEGLAPVLAAGGVRLCVSAGEALPSPLRDAWHAAGGPPIADGWGASELLVLALTALPGDDALQVSPGIEVQPLDAGAVAAGAPTRLLVRSPTLALGYLDRPAATAESFRDGAFCPADLFVRQGAGWRFAGREDSLVKVRGRWLDLVELAARLGDGNAGLREGAAVCAPDSDGIESVLYFYVAATPGDEALRAALATRAEGLPHYQRPARIVELPALPRTATGKLLRRQLQELAQQGLPPALAPVTTSRSGHVLVATLSRPPVNAFDETLLDALDQVLDAAIADPEVTVLHLRSRERVFCAGADLALMRASWASHEGSERMLALVRRMQQLFARLEAAPLVTLAEIGGAALGGGFELALACDLRIAAADARLGLPEAGLGLLPGAGGTQRLTKLAGAGLARRLILGAETLAGSEALALGLVQWAPPAAELAATAAAVAARLAALPRHALAESKHCIELAARGVDDAGFAAEIEGTRRLYQDPETRRRVAAFLEARARSHAIETRQENA